MARILIVDDEKSIRRTLGEFLRAEGHEAIEAEGAEAALERLREASFDVVVTDIILPRVTGVELLRRIHDTAPEVLVVMMTGEPTVETAGESLRAGAMDYLLKPITKAAILRTVANAVRLQTLAEAKRRLEAENRAHQENLERLVDERTRQLHASEERAQELSRFNQAVLDALTAHICVLAEDGTILAVNRAWQDFAATNPPLNLNAGVGTNYLAACEAATGEDAATVREVLRGLCAVRRGDLPEFTLEYPCHSPHEQRWFALRSTRFAGASGGCTVLAYSNITERKLLEAQLRQAQKMEAVGQLAGGVAHDFNNMMAVIRGNADLLLMDADQFSAQTNNGLKHIVGASERAANLTRQLLVFSRKQVMQDQPLALNELIRNLTKMLHRVIREDIHLECRYADQGPFVQADPGMLEQVLLNLVVNARDAMPTGGSLQIATERVRFAPADARAHPEARAGDFACLSVSDAGTGIAPELLPRIFEPFFTTKEPGKGTGLGLATVYGIVKQHQGWVEVASRVGEGTIFKIFLPAISTPAATETAAGPEAELRGGSETILLVEDEFSVRMITRRVLESFHYKVHEATCAREALEVWGQHHGEIALLLTDIVMPEGVSGRDLAQQLRAQRSGLKVIFMSGYSSDVIGKDTEFFRKNQGHFLQKPFPTGTLIRTVRQCLDEK
jgi:signal transduction histidine kinase